MAYNHIPHPAFGGTVSALIHNPLFMAGRDVQVASFKFVANTVFEPGHVLGIGNDGLMRISDASATDGSEVPFAVMQEQLSTELDAQVFNAVTKCFVNELALVLGPGHTLDTVRLPLFRAGIHLVNARYSYA